MKRLFDLFLCILFMPPVLFICIFISLLVKITSPGPVIFWSQRIGRKGVAFSMPKFRTMKIDTPLIATHLLPNPDDSLTVIGKYLRRCSLDELPQYWSILSGKMSFVGPRPALFNQYDLITLRKRYFIDQLTPGLTGWAQINGRDELSIIDKVFFDHEYFNKRSFCFDLKILLLTVFRVIGRSGVAH